MNIQTDKTISPTSPKRVFLDIDSLTQWDIGIFQRFPQPEKVALHGSEPGRAGSWDATVTTYPNVIHENGLYRMTIRFELTRAEIFAYEWSGDRSGQS